MKMIFRYFFTTIFSAFTLVLLQSCNDSEVARTGVKLGVTTTSGTIAIQNGRVATTNGLSFDRGSITIREVVFDGESEAQSLSRTQFQIATIDYTTGEVSPEVFVEVPAGVYTSVNLGIELQDDGSDPSVVIEGTYTTSDNTVLPIRFEFNSGEVFEATAASVTIPAETDVLGKVTFDAIDWFSTTTASELDQAGLTDGVIMISESSNTAIFNKVADRLDVATQAVFE